MAETITLFHDAPAARHTVREPQTLELSVLTTLGTLHLAPAPTASVQEPGCDLPVAPPVFTSAALPTSRRVHYISTRCYDVAFAVLILASAAAALYRLVWMGQP